MERKPARKERPLVIRTPDYRLRLFVSSTLRELGEEREAVRQAILRLRLAPVMFESGARPHPAKELYRSYLSQSHIFIGIYWQSYGWIAPDMHISGLEDEYNLSGDLPRLIYIKSPAPNREPALASMLDRIRDENTGSYKYFTTSEELRELVENDIVLMLTEFFETVRREPPASVTPGFAPLTNLPFPRNPLIGRQQELAAARNLLLDDNVGLLTLTGPGGVGKSRLGIQIALDLLDRFSDGAYLVALETVSEANRVVPAIAAALGVTESPGGPPVAEALKEFLSRKQMLVFIDNFEQVMPAAPRIAELLEACPQVKFLITSRSPLHLRAEKVLPVPPLELPSLRELPDLQPLSQYSAVQLFILRAQGVKPDFQVTNNNAPAVAEICHRLEGLPLAIELAAARSRILPPQALLSRLTHRFEVLRGGTSDLPERQRALYTAIDWSYSLLEEPEKYLLNALSVFVGGFSLEAVEVVCGSDETRPDGIFERLESLIDANLLKPPEEVDGDLRFKLFESIREFAYQHLVDCEDAPAIRNRHAQYYRSFAEQAEAELKGSAQPLWHRRLQSELENFQAAMGWALEQNQNELALHIAMALFPFWDSHGYWREGLGWLEKGLVEGGSIPDALRAKALARAGWLARDLGYTQAIAFLQESLALWRQIGDPAGLASTLNNLGLIVMYQGDYTGATQMLEESLGLLRELGDQQGQLSPLINLGIAAFELGQDQRAIELYSEALQLARAIDDKASVATSLGNLAEVYAQQGDYARAEESYSLAAPIFEELGFRTYAAYVQGSQGIVASKQGQFDRARDLLSVAIRAFHEMEQVDNTLRFIEQMAFVIDRQDHPDRAARLLSASESSRKAIDIPRLRVDQADFDLCLAAVRSRLGNAAFSSAWEQGSHMTLDQSVAFALEESVKD